MVRESGKIGKRTKGAIGQKAAEWEFVAKWTKSWGNTDLKPTEWEGLIRERKEY